MYACVCIYIYIQVYKYVCVSECMYACMYVCMYVWAGIAQSVQRLATGWTFRGSNPGVGEIFRTLPDQPWGVPSNLYMGTASFRGVKRPGRGLAHPPAILALRLKK